MCSVVLFSTESAFMYIIIVDLRELQPPIKRLKEAEFQEVISSLKPKKPPDYGLMTSRNPNKLSIDVML